MQRERDLKRLTENFHKSLKNEDIDCDKLAAHPALARLRSLIAAEQETLGRMADAPGKPTSPEDSFSDTNFHAALEEELIGPVGESVVRELRRSLDAVLHLTRFGRDEPVFRQALLALFLLDKGATHDHPLLRRLFAEAVAGVAGPAEKEDIPLSSERSTLLSAYARKKRLEYRHRTTPELIDLLQEAGDGPAEELMQALIARGREVAPHLLALISCQVCDPEEARGERAGDVVGPACAVLGEIGVSQSLGSLVQCLKADLTDQAAVALAKIGGGAQEFLRGLLEDREEDPEVRVQAVTSLTYLAHLHPDAREEVVRLFREMLRGADEENGEICAWIVCGIGALGASAESQEDIRGVYDRGLMEEDDIDIEEALEGRVDWLSVEDAEEDVLERYRYTDEDWDEGEGFLGGLGAFLNRISEPQEPVRVSEKVGRNAPCPCGSGKKYKKCCGQ